MNTILDNYITKEYKKIVHLARKITKTSDRKVYEELAHHALESFIKHKRAEELIEKKQAMLFLSGIMYRNYHSSTSPWHKLYRYAGKEVPLKTNKGYVQGGAGGDLVAYEDISNLWVDGKEHHVGVWSKATDLPYDEDPNGLERDLLIESIQGIMEDMESDTVEQWFRVVLFKMWLEQPNYSELERITHIPRTSISQAVKECKQYIKQRIENGNNT